MKKKANFYRRMAIAVLLSMVFSAQSAHAQGQFIFLADCRSGNFWSSFLGFPTMWINGMVMSAADYDIEPGETTLPGYGATLRFVTVKNDGQKMDYYGNHFFGFRAEDLFRDFEYSLKFGWQPEQIPVGFYVRAGYRHENFNTRQDKDEAWTKHRLNCFRPGLGIRVSPLENLLDVGGVCPIVEVGANYDIYFNYKGGYDNDKKQLNNGVSTRLSLGLKTENGAAVLLSYERENYDLFNKDFEVNGYKPYANYKTRHFNFALTVDLGI